MCQETDRKVSMTVCIAAVCESGSKIVVAADRMMTYRQPLNLEFETEEQKIEQLGQVVSR